ncbi:MAG: tetratricopeptide repeat protein [Parasulfuritortus sp.]|nr:tetratricopeptide repeat protein [Parasulfuritortus sp.]
MIRLLLLSVLLGWVVTAQANDTWDSLWRTPDQRAEQLLRQGHSAEAARLYRDPKHKAYAELQAGNFSQAAHDFSAFDDSDSHYNRGNALARAGQLQAAIKAYDAALARDPNNRDARHNRDLVARALQQQPQSQSASGKGGQNDKNDKNQDGNGKSGGEQDKPGQNDASGNSQKNESAQGKGSDQKPGQNGPAQNQPGQSGQPGKSGQPGYSSPSAQPGRNGQPEPDDATQAARDAAASLGKAGLGQPAAATGQPATEQQLAREQWLRQIPDDPGGLLRRKFMIEHMIRQQGGTP